VPSDNIITTENRDGLLKQLIPFSHSCVARLIGIWPKRRDDILSESHLELVKAYDAWLTKKADGQLLDDDTFLIYARFCIKRNVHRWIKRDHIIRVPEDEYRADIASVVLEQEFQQSYDDTWLYFCESLDISLEQEKDPNVPSVVDHPAIRLLDAVDSLGLSDRERAIVLYRLAGYSQREIGLKLDLNEARISQHMRDIQTKATLAGLHPSQPRNPSEATQTCIGCLEKLPLDNFYVQRRTPNLQYFARCKVCMKQERDAKRL
jgi:RNA polymerase sigma factor (sigma-70 family)